MDRKIRQHEVVTTRHAFSLLVGLRWLQYPLHLRLGLYLQ
jgi:hypothetical protein